MKKTLFTFLLFYSGALLAAPLNIVTSFSILANIVQEIGGDDVRVQSLVGANSDSHAYQLTGTDVKKIAQANLVILNGLGLEKSDVLRAVQQNRVPYIEAANHIHALKSEEHEEHHHDDHKHAHEEHHHDDHKHEHAHEHGEFDPHIWHDPVLMQRYAANIAIALIHSDPKNARAYQARFQAFSQKLIELDTFARAQFKAIPLEKRTVLTGHDAFQYLAHRYHIQFFAPQSVSTETEASAQTVAALIRQIKAQRIQAIFTENIKDNRLIARITQETQSKIGGQLYSDALSDGAPAANYADLFRHNIRTLANALK